MIDPYIPMDGPWRAKQYVTNYLAADLPDRLVHYRNAWGRSEEDLPDPSLIDSFDRGAVDHWPTITTVNLSLPKVTRDDYTETGDPIYRVRYTLRTYVWVKAGPSGDLVGEGASTRMRDELSTVVLSALLDHPALRSPDPNGLYDVLIDEGTIEGQYSDLTGERGDRYASGVYFQYQLALREQIFRAPLGQVTKFIVEATNTETGPTADAVQNLLDLT